jgi:hypothetical protein
MTIDPLNEIRNILDEFEEKIAHTQTIWEELRELNPSFEQVNEEHWRENHSKIWLHGGTTPNECNELERWLYGDPPITTTAHSSAKEIHDAWRNWLKTAGIPKWKISYGYDKKNHQYREMPSKELGQTYYVDDDRFAIQEPHANETLLAFIVRLAREVEDTGKGHRLEWRALKSFLDFIRNQYPAEQVAFLEHIFPKKMDLHYGKIIRLIPQESYPIPEKTAAEILIEFARRCHNGRPDSRHTAAEGLALCWLCIATSRIRLPKTLEMVNKIKANAVLSGAQFSISKTPTYGSDCATCHLSSDNNFSVLQVPTWFGEQPLKISNSVAAFLRAVARIPSKKPRETIFQRPMGSLRRVFDEVLRSVSPPSEYGNITYLSLLNQPHIFGDHRPQHKY